jgi:hypothetical protein
VIGTELIRGKRKLAKQKFSSLCPLVLVLIVGRRQGKNFGEVKKARY